MGPKTRDYADLEDTNLAVYNFRGYTVLRFYKKEKQLEFGNDANMCHFIPEDYLLMANFISECSKFCKGEVDDVKNVEVS